MQPNSINISPNPLCVFHSLIGFFHSHSFSFLMPSNTVLELDLLKISIEFRASSSCSHKVSSVISMSTLTRKKPRCVSIEWISKKFVFEVRKFDEFFEKEKSPYNCNKSNEYSKMIIFLRSPPETNSSLYM